MPTFRRKNSVVDARQFTGDRQKALDLILWVNSNNGRAMWNDVIGQFTILICGHIVIVHKNYWVVLNQDGTFDRLSPEDFAEEFEQV